MAVFEYLHHVGEVLVEMVVATLTAVDEEEGVRVAVGPPMQSPLGTGPEVRVTLLWVTPLATHRNDAWERDTTGNRVAPPLSLSAYYLISTYGSTVDEDPIDAHNLLGRALQAFHSDPHPVLPIAPSTHGEGPIEIVLVPTTAELLEKVYTALQLEHRAWVIFEVGPVQLGALSPSQPPLPVVRPGGLRIGGVTTEPPPRLRGASPREVGVGGRVRVDVELHGRTLHGLDIDGHYTALASLDELVAGSSYVLTLPGGVEAGVRRLRARVGDAELDAPEMWSEPEQLRVLSADTPSVDAVTAATSLSDDLVLSGRALSSASEVVFWPAEGIAEPSDIKSATPSSIGASSVTVTSAELGVAGLTAGSWRVSVQLDAHVYTTAIIVELTEAP